jgi:hypothetical protein
MPAKSIEFDELHQVYWVPPGRNGSLSSRRDNRLPNLAFFGVPPRPLGWHRLAIRPLVRRDPARQTARSQRAGLRGL